jgi:UDP-glucose 4-epimerase
VCRVLNSESKIYHEKALSADIAIRIPSVEKTFNILGYKAKVDLEEGILKTAKWMQKSII